MNKLYRFGDSWHTASDMAATLLVWLGASVLLIAAGVSSGLYAGTLPLTGWSLVVTQILAGVAGTLLAGIALLAIALLAGRDR